MAVHHFNVPVAPDVSDRFMVLHYTDWESLNGRNINNWVRAEATQPSLRLVRLEDTVGNRGHKYRGAHGKQAQEFYTKFIKDYNIFKC